jgi:hypothetical protein
MYKYSLYALLLIFVIFTIAMKSLNKRNMIGERIMETFLEFIHIPKNAGTTIENIGNESGLRWGRFSPEDRNFVTEGNCTYWHIPPKYYKPGSKYDTDETFCVIRNPYDRMVSEYAYRHSHDSSKDNAADMNAWLREHLNEMHVKKGMMNCHFIPQSEYMNSSHGKRSCTYPLKFENLTSEFNDLMRKKGINVVMPENKRDNQSNFSLSANDIDSVNKGLISEYYRDDIELWSSLSNVRD